ncbi:MAG: class I mannose-6-phosphate isomerase [Salinibacterium sp.]|nr:class I mannose-6-phosphate isomerase [Salinibacterium sp.]
MEPILLPSNQPPARFFQGGQRISTFRNDPPAEPNTPEDWIASTTCVRGHAPVGMTQLPGGELFADAVLRDPISWLGATHVQRYGVDTMLLVKLLDAGQRLPVHAHPDGSFAAQHLSAAHGKAEAWYVLAPGVVHLGLTREVAQDELRALVSAQDSQELLSLTHEVTVRVGDSVFVPPGLLHAIGAGVLVAEVQEPEDLSILLEWTGFDGLDGEKDGHLGLGFDLALTAVEMRARSAAEVEALVKREAPEGPLLPEAADQYFRFDRVVGRRDFPAGLSIVIALTEPARLTLVSGVSRMLAPGSTVLIAHAMGTYRIDGSALVARPPLAKS